MAASDVVDSVCRYGGHIAKYLGDGVLAYFGWPQAPPGRERNASRPVPVSPPVPLTGETDIGSLADRRTSPRHIGWGVAGAPF